MITIKDIHYEFRSTWNTKSFIQSFALFSHKKSPKKILTNISFELAKGDRCAIIGSNGSGKSTLLKMIAGILVPSMGTIRVNNRSPSHDRIEHVRRLGMVWGQRSSLWWDLPVKESLITLGKIRHQTDETINQELIRFDNLLHLSLFWDRPIRTLSLGQRVKSDIVAALMHKPELLILDEPFLGLDYQTRKIVIECIKKEWSSHQFNLILASHNFSDIKELVDKCVIIKNGIISYSGPICEIPLKKINNVILDIVCSCDVYLNDNIKSKFNINHSFDGETNRFEFDDIEGAEESLLSTIGVKNIISFKKRDLNIEDRIMNLY